MRLPMSTPSRSSSVPARGGQTSVDPGDASPQAAYGRGPTLGSSAVTPAICSHTGGGPASRRKGATSDDHPDRHPGTDVFGVAPAVLVVLMTILAVLGIIANVAMA